MDKIGEVIGPKGKVINALQQETGADIAVDDDGMVGTVTIGAKDGTAVDEARRRISTILDPPLAEVGATYQGKVVNITKFGAFVNILPGRDGLLHISKIGQGKRVERVEDVLELGPAGRGEGGRHRPAGQGVPVAGRRGAGRRRRPAALTVGRTAVVAVAAPAVAIVRSRRSPDGGRSGRSPGSPGGGRVLRGCLRGRARQEFGDLGPAGPPSRPSARRWRRRPGRSPPPLSRGARRSTAGRRRPMLRRRRRR